MVAPLPSAHRRTTFTMACKSSFEDAEAGVSHGAYMGASLIRSSNPPRGTIGPYA